MASKRSRFEDVKFDSYIYKLLKQVHPDNGLSGDGLSEINNIVRIMLKKVIEALNKLLITSRGQKTISSRDIQSACRLVLPGELSKNGVSQGTKAVTHFNSYEKKAGDPPLSRSKRAGLLFPVTRVETLMMELTTINRKSATSAVYLTAVLEYVTAEILELAGNAARDNKKIRITPRHIKLAILNDTELSALLTGVVMSGGVNPSINAKLLQKKDEKTHREPRANKKKTSRKSTKPTKPNKR